MSSRQIWVPSEETGLPDSARSALALEGPPPRNVDELQWRVADKAQELYDRDSPEMGSELDYLAGFCCEDSPPTVRDCIGRGRERLADLAGNPSIFLLAHDALSEPPEKNPEAWEERLDEQDFLAFLEDLNATFRTMGWLAI